MLPARTFRVYFVRLVEELSTTAQQVVLPALLKKIKSWIGVDLSDETQRRPSMAGSEINRNAYEVSEHASSHPSRQYQEASLYGLALSYFDDSINKFRVDWK